MSVNAISCLLCCRSDPLQTSKYEFDKVLLDDYKGTLLAEDVALNDLTVEALEQRYRAKHPNIFILECTL